MISGGRGHLRKQGGPKATFDVSISIAEEALEIVMQQNGYATEFYFLFQYSDISLLVLKYKDAEIKETRPRIDMLL